MRNINISMFFFFGGRETKVNTKRTQTGCLRRKENEEGVVPFDSMCTHDSGC